MLAEAVVGGFSDRFAPAIITRGQFSAIINLDEDRPHKIFILMAPNYPEQSPAKQRAPMPFKKSTWHLLKYSIYGECIRLIHCEHLRWYNLFRKIKWFLVCDCHRLCSYQWSLATKCALHRCASLSLSRSDWPRSEVMADAVSTSWVSFRSSSSIHLHYKRKPRVSAEPWRQTCQTTS